MSIDNPFKKKKKKTQVFIFFRTKLDLSNQFCKAYIIIFLKIFPILLLKSNKLTCHKSLKKKLLRHLVVILLKWH